MDAQTSANNPPGFLNGFLKYLPAIQWILMLAIAASVFALAQRDLQTAQAQEVRDNARSIKSLEIGVEKSKEEHARQLDQLRREMLTREVFDAYHRADADRMERMEKMIERILENQVR